MNAQRRAFLDALNLGAMALLLGIVYWWPWYIVAGWWLVESGVRWSEQ